MRVVILGGGYAAIWSYRAVRRRMGSSARITVVAPFTEQVFHGFTGEVLDGALSPALQTSPLEECVPRAERVRGWATAVDPEGRTVRVEHEGRTTVLEYDQLVVATGAHDDVEKVPGLGRHGFALRFPGLVGRLLDHLEQVAGRPAVTPVERERRDTVVVVGAGFAGTEVAAALGRRFAGTTVVLVSSAPTVVPLWHDRPVLQRRLLQNLREAGVELRLGARVAEVDAHGVRLQDGTRIESATVVSTLGNTVPPIPGLEGFQDPDGLLRVDATLQVTDGVWAAGDVAAVPFGTERAPKEALWAIRAGTTVGRNVARAARGAGPRPFAFTGLGTVAAFAPGRAVALMWGVALPQGLAWVVRAGFFLWYVPSRRTAVRIVGWSLRPGRRAEHVALPAAAPVPAPALVGLTGGVTAAERLRSALRREDAQRARGA